MAFAVEKCVKTKYDLCQNKDPSLLLYDAVEKQLFIYVFPFAIFLQFFEDVDTQ